jgi:DNA (cytosine-5)-methyltransferase 1
MEYKMGELFCGPGGLGIAAKNAEVSDPETENSYSIAHQWATDKHEDSCKTYRRNICPDDPESVICAPIEDLDLEELPPIDCLSFGFPCNDFSQVGEKHGFDGEYGPLYTYGVGVLENHELPKMEKL